MDSSRIGRCIIPFKKLQKAGLEQQEPIKNLAHKKHWLGKHTELATSFNGLSKEKKQYALTFKKLP